MFRSRIIRLRCAMRSRAKREVICIHIRRLLPGIAGIFAGTSYPQLNVHVEEPFDAVEQQRLTQKQRCPFCLRSSITL